jgi:hypothetical protein
VAKKQEFIIDDETIHKPGVRDRVFAPVVDGEVKSHGLVPRDYSKFPQEMFAQPSEMQLIPRAEWSARIKELEKQKARLSDLRTWPSLDQNGQGYCWAYSTTATAMLTRAADNLPYVRLSAHSVACKVMNFADRGGWCGLSAKFIRENGIVPASLWPEKSMSRANDTPAAWEAAKSFRITEDWVDLARREWDQNLTFDQVATCLLSGIPCAVDFNWWAHSVCAMDLVEVEPGSFGLRILNSWTDQWGDKGVGILRGSQAIPDGAIATRVVGS